MSASVTGGGLGEPAGQIRRRWLPNTEVIGPAECPILHRWTLVPWGERTDGPGRGCWTVVIMGPLQRQWGFWRAGEWPWWRDYERKYGFGMRCDSDG